MRRKWSSRQSHKLKFPVRVRVPQQKMTNIKLIVLLAAIANLFSKVKLATSSCTPLVVFTTTDTTIDGTTYQGCALLESLVVYSTITSIGLI